MKKVEKKSDNDREALVKQSNKLINARFMMTLLERRIFLKMVSMIKPTDKDFQDVLIEVKDVIEDTLVQGNSLYAELRKATSRLLKHVCELDEGKQIVQVSLISSATYIKGKAIIKLRFDPALKPYLLELKKNFTVFGLRQALKLRSYYSLRIYELLKQFAGTGYRLMPLEDLRFALGIKDEYANYADFKKRVILKAQEELANTDMKFEFNEVKSGRKVVAIEFKFSKNNGIKELEYFSEDKMKIVNDLLETGLTEPQVKEILSAGLSEKDIYKTLYDVAIANLNGKIENRAAYTYKVLKSKAGLS